MKHCLITSVERIAFFDHQGVDPFTTFSAAVRAIKSDNRKTSTIWIPRSSPVMTGKRELENTPVILPL